MNSTIRAVVSPVTAPVELDEPVGPDRTVRAEVEVTPEEPVFAGHYPGFPVFPGVCVLDLVHRTAVQGGPPGRRVRLSGVRSAKFGAAVYPGDHLTIELRWTEPAGRDEPWSVSASVHRAELAVANMRLSYREE
ncbi:3-hydroxyacyl-[acyl-carrier-protein] dehydratase [Actinopolyspora alba]|uniref:3-hydroxyacyl-[acyl-carrier-protein] dehydratase n=1 Tax=Actinopolyspora alba TaxID=673379 RepID=A0A1I1TP50_9ACTN|nr:beta-hydroxyacyl-ACP dehydratase [Actinopolyspora alba]SFD60506.1 3-hydroxyacyl-[acyl-carrier-protein] dehydratase [Actinopolyspora alba]